MVVIWWYYIYVEFYTFCFIHDMGPFDFFCQSERSIFKKEKNFCWKSDQQKNPFWDPLPSSGLADIASAQGKRVICTRKICPKASVVVSSCIFYGFMQLINPRSTESLLPRKRKKRDMVKKTVLSGTLLVWQQCTF